MSINEPKNIYVAARSWLSMETCRRRDRHGIHDAGDGHGPHFAGMRAQAVEPVQTTTIPHTKITGDGNYFTFADNVWDPGNDVHTWSGAIRQPPGGGHLVYGRFFGSAIDVYAGKNRPWAR